MRVNNGGVLWSNNGSILCKDEKSNGIILGVNTGSLDGESLETMGIGSFSGSQLGRGNPLLVIPSKRMISSLGETRVVSY